MKYYYYLLISLFSLCFCDGYAQTNIGTGNATILQVYEYYNHTGVEWVHLFRVKNFDANQGNWGRSGAAGRVYFVDYQGEGGSYVDFSFPQSLNSSQKPVLLLNGNSADNFSWYVYQSSYGPGQEYYDFYLKMPAWHVGLTFLLRDYDCSPFFASETPPATGLVWSSQGNQESVSFFRGDGSIGLGTLKPGEKLSVNGKIRAKEMKVEAENWPDYVFGDSYQKPSLSSVEDYLKAERHLPGIPSAADVGRDGVSLGDMNARLLKKVEELTLYLIEQDKRIKQLEAKGSGASAGRRSH
ncbi:hypothetical protein GS399_05400 [Pedobacter sp. HMF7647]|uniref:Uncharacterized protein n=1 Tax=Hufsiella arboris TaxID=2695275 RepID=A0A7K1Y7N8_9SPHI|nr:hypothetical protein [Hufsiella arboris]MXV50401.1 hypothetical protein [Hufsiella arboris]